MVTLLQATIPIFMIWLLWIAFRPRKRNGNSPSTSCGDVSASGYTGDTQGACSDSGGSCDGGGDGGGGGD